MNKLRIRCVPFIISASYFFVHVFTPLSLYANNQGLDCEKLSRINPNAHISCKGKEWFQGKLAPHQPQSSQPQIFAPQPPKAGDFDLKKMQTLTNGDDLYQLITYVATTDSNGKEVVVASPGGEIFTISQLEQRKSEGAPNGKDAEKYLQRIKELNAFEQNTVTVKKLPLPESLAFWVNSDGTVKNMNPVQAEDIRHLQKYPRYEFTFYKKDRDANGNEFTAVARTVTTDRDELEKKKATILNWLIDHPYDGVAQQQRDKIIWYLKKIDESGQ